MLYWCFQTYELKAPGVSRSYCKKSAKPYKHQTKSGCLKNLNYLTPNGHYMGRTAQLTSRRCILYIYSTNTRTEYFKHAA